MERACLFCEIPVLFISWCFLYSKGNILSSLWLEAFWPLQLYLLTWCTLYWELFLSLVFDGRSNGGSSLLRPLLPTLSPPESVVSYEDDFASSPGSSTLTDKKPCTWPQVTVFVFLEKSKCTFETMWLMQILFYNTLHIFPGMLYCNATESGQIFLYDLAVNVVSNLTFRCKG